MLLAEIHPFNPIGKVLVPLIYLVSSGGALLVCLIFAVIAYRRTRHTGFLWMLIGFGFSVFNQFLYSRSGIAMWESFGGTFIDTLLKLYDVFVARSVIFICLAIAIWQLGIGRRAVLQNKKPKDSE